MTSKFSKEFGNIICFNINNIINNVITKTHTSYEQILPIFNDLLEYSKEFIDYIYEYRYNITNIDDNNIFFNSNIHNDAISNNSTYINHTLFLIFTYFRDFNFNITDKIKSNILSAYENILFSII